jgi:hypothetical protein
VGILGKLGKGFAAIGGLGTGFIPGAEVLAVTGGLAASLDPDGQDEVLNPFFGFDMYAQGGPLWGVPRHVEDEEYELSGIGLKSGNRSRIRAVWERRGREERYVKGSQAIGWSVLSGTSIEPILDLGRGKNIPLRQVVREDQLQSYVSRVSEQLKAHEGKAPIFHYLDNRTLEQFARSYFDNNARPVGEDGLRLQVRRADANGPKQYDWGPPLQGWNGWWPWIKVGSKVQDLWAAKQAEADIKRADQTQAWIGWKQAAAVQAAKDQAVAQFKAAVDQAVAKGLNPATVNLPDLAAQVPQVPQPSSFAPSGSTKAEATKKAQGLTAAAAALVVLL